MAARAGLGKNHHHDQRLVWRAKHERRHPRTFSVYMWMCFLSFFFALCFGYTASCRGQVSSKWWEKDTPGFILILFFSSFLEEHKIEEEGVAGAGGSAGCTILRFAVLCQDGFPHRFFHPQNHSHRRAENDERDRFGLYRLIKYLHLSECMFLSDQRGWWAFCGGGGMERTATQRKAKPPIRNNKTFFGALSCT